MKIFNPILLTGGVTINPNLDLDTMFNGIVNLIINIAFGLGAIIAVGGCVSWIMARQNDNPDAQSKAVNVILCGGLLMGLTTVLRLAGIIV